MSFPKITSFKSVDDFVNHIRALPIEMPFDPVVKSGDDSPLGGALMTPCGEVGNRFSILPMEGWDGTTDGMPTDLTIRRWQRFGESGAKLIWGGEAVAVTPEGRANPNQLMLNESTQSAIASLRTTLIAAHAKSSGSVDDLKVGLQLTHSGRFARPNKKDQIEPTIAYAHPILDPRFKIADSAAVTISDDGLKRLIEKFVEAAQMADKIGFDFVDIKQCHGYFGHELLSGFDRPGEFGGSFENRTRFIREVISGIQAETKIAIGSRISIFDFAPFTKSESAVGVSQSDGPYPFAFGGDGSGEGIDLQEPQKVLQMMSDQGVKLICTTAGSPYYNPHIQRPATAPPSDGYLPPEDPLVGVARQIQATAELKKSLPETVFVGSGYSYLQDWLPNVGQAVIAGVMADSIGLGRMVLSYPDLPLDVIAGEKLQRKKICRTFSDCTTAPRNGMVSGCFPLDPFYKARPERKQLVQIKKDAIPKAS
jgi:2,4-dienoyl-CoA reductase-like NADH-dependent reductase (Old Yellow Enzyme family)